MNSAETAELFRTAQEWSADGVAAAVVVDTWRTAPRPVGGRLIVRRDAVFAGSVSGGCVEKEVIMAAQTCMEKQQSQMLSFGVADETAWQSGLSCGGQIEIYVAPFPSEKTDGPSKQAIDDFLHAEQARQSGVLITRLQDGGMRFLQTEKQPADSGLQQTLPEEWKNVFGNTPQNAPQNASQNANDENLNGYFIEWCAPPWRLFIVGAAHIAQALAPMAASCGFDVVIIDPRSGFARAERFPQAKMVTEWPDEAFAAMPLDSRTAVVTLSHDPKIDDPALIAGLRANAPYIGALGSVRTHERRNERLREAGFAHEDIGRIRAPVGLNINAQTAAEIAVSILAEIIAAVNPDKK